MMGMFYKMVFDISCFYAFASFFFYYVAGYETNAMSCDVFYAAALMLAFSAGRKRNGKALTAIAAMIPAIALLLETTALGRLEVILLWIYFLFTIRQESYLIYHYRFLDKFKVLLCAWGVPVIFVLFDIDRGIPAANRAIPYLILFLAAGVLTLQAARHRGAAESRKQFEKYQIFQTVLFFTVAALLTSTDIVHMVYYYVLLPVVNFLTLSVERIMQLFGKAISSIPGVHIGFKPDMKGFQEELMKEESNEIQVMGNEWGEMIAELTAGQEPKDPTPLLICLGIVFIVILLIVLMGKAARQSKVTALDVEREDLPKEQEKKKVKKSFWNPETTVRYYYREFMKKAETREQELLKSDTTEEIKKKYNSRTSAKTETAEQITDVYRKVRYSGKAVTKEDASKMKSLVKDI